MTRLQSLCGRLFETLEANLTLLCHPETMDSFSANLFEREENVLNHYSTNLINQVCVVAYKI